MPIFEYRCGQCGKSFEFLQRGKETPSCPVCGSHKLTKLLSRFSAHVQGGSVGGGGGSCTSCSGGSCATCGK